MSKSAVPNFWRWRIRCGCDLSRFTCVNCIHSKISFEKNCFSAWASTLNMGLINKVVMVCLSPVGYGV